MSDEKNPLQFSIYTYKGISSHSDARRRIGYATPSKDGSYYVIDFAMFPYSYYLKKKQNSGDQYSVYARRYFRGDIARFSSVVGEATLQDDRTAYMEFYFPIFNTPVYMSLFPA